MFNRQQFEDELYEMVTRRINEFFIEVLKDEDKSLLAEAFKFIRQFLSAMFFVINESVTQILYGVSMYRGGK